MVRLAKSLPRVIPKKPTPPPPMKVEIDRTEELALLSTIAERLVEKEPEKEIEPPEQVEVINQPKVQKVEVLNFPPPMECKHDMPTEIRVSNLPGTQPVSVDELPLPNNAATQEEQMTMIDTLEQIKETVDKLKFNRDGELKTTGSGGYGAGGVRSSLLPADASTATNQVAGNASLASIDAKLTNPLPVSGTVTANPSYLITRLDDAGSGITYVGKAAAGTATSASAWQIFRLDESLTPDLTTLFADGVTTFTKVWDDRSTYSFS